MTEKRIRVLGVEYPVSPSTVKKLRKMLEKQKKMAGGEDELCYALEDAIELLEQELAKNKQ